MKRTIDDLKITAVEEGNTLSEEIQQTFDLDSRDIHEITGLDKVYSFTGVVCRGDSILISFPKHYISIKEFNNFSTYEKIQHIRLILKTIIEYETNPEFSDYTNAEDFNPIFSFKAFYDIVNYYQQFGLYHRNRKILKKNSTGKISWKTTLTKSQKILSNGNLIFTPLFKKQTAWTEDFITRCMVFAINYTEELFGLIMELPDNSSIVGRGIDENIRNNYTFVIFQLQMLLSQTFKDLNKQLINSLISFFQGLNHNNRIVRDIKDYHFNNIWERAVEKYLNDHFAGVENETLKFLNQGTIGPFTKITLSAYNEAHPSHKLEPDHYYYDVQSQTQYIFDSKYYHKLNSLNFKQVVYHMLMANRAVHTYDALILPYEFKTKTGKHLELSKNYLIDSEHPITILVTHLNTNKVLKNFVSQTDKK